jgi:hypothetical protein
LKYKQDLYSSAESKNKNKINELFTKLYNRPPDPENATDLEQLKTLMYQSVFNRFGQESKPKATDRVQP